VESYLSCRNQYDANPECVTEAYDSYGVRTIPVHDSNLAKPSYTARAGPRVRARWVCMCCVDLSVDLGGKVLTRVSLVLVCNGTRRVSMQH
jgi:hypothetical protein